jgi:sugar lactone lactonase YvrE
MECASVIAKKATLNSVQVLAILSLMLLVGVADARTPARVTTLAGGYVGDGKPAKSASLADPIGLVGDGKGNLYVSDSIHCRIRKINSNGLISTFAGTGICGYSGDGGPAASAMLNGPAGLATDRFGNLFVADQGNSRIRKITPSATITTIAGNGTAGYSGDGGPATQANLGSPGAVSVDPSGNVYIGDSNFFVIRKVDTGGIIHTAAGNGTYGFSGDGGPATSAQITSPTAVVADGSGNFYVADSGNYRVRRVDFSGTITTWAGGGSTFNGGSGGPATGAGLGVTDALLMAGGKLYISTTGNIWSVDQSTQIINLIAGNSSGAGGFNGDGNAALSTNFYYPSGMILDGRGNLLVVDSTNDRVRKIDSSQIVTTIAGGYLGDGAPATAASLNLAYLGGHTAVDADGNLYIADTNNNRVRKVSPTGTITTFAGTGISGYSGDGGPATSATLNAPTAVVLDGAGNILIGDNGNGAIRKVDTTGTITTYVSTVTVVAPWGGTITVPVYASGLALDANGNLYASTFGYAVILKIAPDTTGTVVAGVLFSSGYNGDGKAATEAYLNLPTGIALDGAGNLYIADWENERIRKVDTNGIISTVAGNGIPGFSGDGGPATAAEVSLPNDVATDAKGNLYISDFLNYRVRVVNTSGTIQTLAGSGTWGYNGNNLPAKMTNLFPSGVTVGPDGTVYVSDFGSQRVRRIR